MTEIAWTPSDEYIANANVTRLMRTHGIATIADLRRRSVQDIEWFWDAVVKDLGIEFSTPYEGVLDDSGGPPWAKWFTGGRINLVWNCVDRWSHGPAKDQIALIGESETGATRGLTFADVRSRVDQVAAGVREAGVVKGDAVAVYMPMVPEAAIAAYAIMKIGAIYMPIFSGFAPSAVAARLRDASAKLLFTADGPWRRGQHGGMKPAGDAGAAQPPPGGRGGVRRNIGADEPTDRGPPRERG